MKALIFIVIMAFTSSSQAFNWQRCTAQQWAGGGIIGMTSSIFSSTGQFTSSTGDCSPLVAEHTVRVFIAQNHENLKSDLARQQGEALETLIFMTELNPQQTEELLNNSNAQTLLLNNDLEGFFQILQRMKNS